MNLQPVLWILLLPFIGSLIQAVFGKAVVRALGPATGKRVMGALAVAPIAIAFFFGFQLTQQLALQGEENRVYITQFSDWITLSSIKIPFEVYFDTLSATMVLIITGIGSMIHLYATGYMAEEREYPRFFTYLNLFIGFMLILVLGGNMVLTFVGWEGVGLCSYLLIGFWYKEKENAKAANKAFIVNRIGDWGMSLGMFLIMVVVAGYGRTFANSNRLLSYDVILKVAANLQGFPILVTAIALLLFVGACGKSAQFPLYLWLPDAMAGPTPVSALIHAATMVTSGVFLLNRLHIFFENSAIASCVVCAVGAFTALFAALIAFGQTDIKKVLAYSTVSQLGYMFIGCGAGGPWTGMFHVTTHAFFKALLFLGSGAVIHAMAHEQDMRNYGKLARYIPFTAFTMVIGWLAICAVSIPGVFGFAGAYSKESILTAAFNNETAQFYGTFFGRTGEVPIGKISGWIGLFTAMLTAIYMTRMTWLTFFGKKERWREIPAHAEGHEHAHAHEEHAAHAEHAHEDHGHEDAHGFFFTDEEVEAIHAAEAHDEHGHHGLDAHHTPREVPASMLVPLGVLAFLSVFGGWWLDRSERFRDWLYPNLVKETLPLEPFKPFNWKLEDVSLVFAGAGIVIGLLIYFGGLPGKEGWDLKKWSRWRLLAGRQFGYDSAMVSAFVEGGGEFGRFLWKGFDATIVDGVVNGAGWFAASLGRMFRVLQTGLVRGYALLMLFGGIALLGFAAVKLLGGGH